MSFPKFSTIATTIIPLLLTLIPTMLVWLYFSSLDIATWTDTYSRLLNVTVCMSVGFLSLSIYLFIWATPQQIEKKHLRDVLFILVVWGVLALTVLLSFLGSVTFLSDFSQLMMFILWLIWGFLNVRAYHHINDEYSLFTRTMLWSWLAYVITVYEVYRQYIVPLVEVMTGTGSN